MAKQQDKKQDKAKTPKTNKNVSDVKNPKAKELTQEELGKVSGGMIEGHKGQ